MQGRRREESKCRAGRAFSSGSSWRPSPRPWRRSDPAPCLTRGWPGILPEAEPVTESVQDGGRRTNGTVAVRAARATGSCDDRDSYLAVSYSVACGLCPPFPHQPLTCPSKEACTGGNHSAGAGRGRLPLLWDRSSSRVGQAEERRVGPRPWPEPAGWSSTCPCAWLPQCSAESSRWARLTSRVKNLSTEFSSHRGGATGGFGSSL